MLPAKSNVSEKPSRRDRDSPLLVLTIGHSTRTIEQFIDLLHVHGVTRVVDVRTMPRSKHNPQFNKDTLPVALEAANISYVHLPELGGLRPTTRDSINTGWRNSSFRGFADYMQTPEFKRAIDQLLQLAKHDRLALMCAEAVPWRCHRSLIADALFLRGVRTEDIMSTTRRQVHGLTPFAKVRGMQITYPAESLPEIPKESAAKNSLSKGRATKVKKSPPPVLRSRSHESC